MDFPHYSSPACPNQQQFLTWILAGQLSFTAISSFPDDVISSEKYKELNLRTEE